MKAVVKSVIIASTIFCVGCSLLRPAQQPQRQPQLKVLEGRNTRSLFIKLETDPSGAEVFWPTGSGLRRLGVTPCQILVSFERKRVKDAFGEYVGWPQWNPVPVTNQPYTITRRENEFIIRLTNLRFYYPGYEPESFSAEWRVPASLLQREHILKWKPITSERFYKIIFRSPTEPKAICDMEVECANGAAFLHQLNADGTLGPLVGKTPIVSRIGFAQRRDAYGRGGEWLVWPQHTNLWWVGKDGILMLNAALMLDGYEPEIIPSCPVINVSELEKIPRKKITLFMSRPTAPQHELSLALDSLPSQADIYLLRADGSLGQKLGQTPARIKIGVAQRLIRNGLTYEHSDWLLWGPSGLLRKETAPDGSVDVILMLALFKEGFAVETREQTVFTLRPGRGYPEDTTLTIPLLRPEQAAARESQKIISPTTPYSYGEGAAGPIMPVRIVWESPPPPTNMNMMSEEPRNKSRRGEGKSFWSRIPRLWPK